MRQRGGIAYSLNEAIDFVTVEIVKPSGFIYGVFRVTISISGAIRERIEGWNVTVEILTLPKRFFRHEDMKFMNPPRSEKEPWRSRFIDGEWTGIVQTNGISEEENPTSMDVVRDALIAQMIKALQPWKKEESSRQVAHRPI